MSETCIVCLGDLGESGNDLDRALSPAVKLEHAVDVDSNSPHHLTDQDDERIAHLLPCGHDLHNGCLKPWVERANSCPICRQSFNKVELSLLVGGPISSSYTVDDRTQVADIDPSMYIDELDDDLGFPPCPVCDDDDDEELLLSCDGCDTDYHTYCVGLDQLPRGHWFCDNCITHRAVESINTSRTTRRSHRLANRRTRAQQRRERTQLQASHSGWARVWQSVWDRLNIDLDFPFDDENAVSQGRSGARGPLEHRDVRQWERRLQIADRQGGANRFRETASALLDIHEIRRVRAALKRPASPEPESQEELRAWNALEKAKVIQLDSNTNARKRKSPTASPADASPVPEPERPLKRPRTRRNPDNSDPPSDSAAESSVRKPVAGAPPRSEGPSFLQSLLKEVECSTPPDDVIGPQRSSNVLQAGRSSPSYSSPFTSPPTSNHASPRAVSATPPPSLSPRSGSPLSLTSKVEPIFPTPEFSPARSPPDSHRSISDWQQNSHELRHPRPHSRYPWGSNPPPSDEKSPSRASMSLTAKEGVARMVSSALRPHYHNSEISKDEYTDINRSVSRMLYEKVGAEENLNDHARESWEKMASEEVTKAVQSLKSAI